ncbi:hypothetical protein O7627_12135 [Solwaraspora sp. WMMD1047]|uniref:hypothetical protein n=1 Tax=Solwaraspora sp. WMMD1047 TaxID=3016102 RepID=UPI002416D7BC|nr:hypothetical protein [Solwaraspora sp. WMMD1047]MDG4830047.1 hypothetical protein [Solwaraspora sp. WMMD1047]
MSTERQHPVSGARVAILDAPPEVQAWVDSFILSAQQGTGNFPHPHPVIPTATIPLGTLEQLVTENLGSLPWGEMSLSSGETSLSSGEMSLSSQDGGATAVRPRHDPEHDTDPSSGSAYHNLLHKMLGDFH